MTGPTSPYGAGYNFDDFYKQGGRDSLMQNPMQGAGGGGGDLLSMLLPLLMAQGSMDQINAGFSPKKKKAPPQNAMSGMLGPLMMYQMLGGKGGGLGL